MSTSFLLGGYKLITVHHACIPIGGKIPLHQIIKLLISGIFISPSLLGGSKFTGFGFAQWSHKILTPVDSLVLEDAPIEKGKEIIFSPVQKLKVITSPNLNEIQKKNIKKKKHQLPKKKKHKLKQKHQIKGEKNSFNPLKEWIG